MNDVIDLTDRTPYTYLIGWSAEDRWYYGVRYGKGCHPDDLWVKYFTSSGYVKKFREAHGEPDVVQVRKTFNSAHKACLWEDALMKRMKIVGSARWLNRNNSSYLYVNNNLIEKAAETRRKRVYNKQVAWNKGLTKDTDTRLKALSEKTQGVSKSDEHKANMKGKKKSNTSKMGQYVRTLETKEKLSRTLRQKPPIRKTRCSYCNKLKRDSTLLEHEKRCHSNPINVKYCVVCSAAFYAAETVTCSRSCGVKLGRTRRIT